MEGNEGVGSHPISTTEASAVEARTILAMREYADGYISKRLRFYCLWAGLLLAAVASLGAILGYPRFEDLLSDMIRTHVDESFGEVGAQQMKQNLAEAQTQLEGAQTLLKKFQEQESRLKQLNAMERLALIERQLNDLEDDCLSLRRGSFTGRKGHKFDVVLGTKILEFKIGEIRVSKEEVEVRLEVVGTGFYVPLRAQCKYDQFKQRELIPTVFPLGPFGHDKIHFALVGADGDTVTIVYQVSPSLVTMASLYKELFQSKQAPQTSTAPPEASGKEPEKHQQNDLGNTEGQPIAP